MATEQLTGSNGAPLASLTNSMTAGQSGPILLQDFNFVDHIAHFDRERIPERVVHANGSGAFGYFEVTHDITQYTKADLFSEVGKRTPLAVRFSTVGGESGSADTARDPRGFAVKFYTKEGNWDLVGNNTPIFFIRDPIFFPSFIHTQKRNPVTHLPDANMFWDFITLRPETTHQVMFLFSDRGIPDGYRFMNGYGSHTFKFVNEDDQFVWVKFHFKVDQGIKNIPADEAARLAGTDPDYSQRDLFNAIAKGDFPSWSLKIQVMTDEEAQNFEFNPFDLTKVWPHDQFPLIPVGKMVLNRNPENYFADVEQIAFAPSHMVPGVEPSPDKMLQGRLFSYNDTHRHRLGANYQQLPVNCPFATKVANYQRDGPMAINNQKGAPNYFPNSYGGPEPTDKAKHLPFPVTGNADRYKTDDDDNFTQPGQFWTNVLNTQERRRLVENIAGNLINADLFLQERAISNFSKVHPDFGNALSKTLTKLQNGKL
eukprot:TRINITY_DN444_c0_g1_i1.p1 TRINITY_DN444_c0_g1~~TRINITY_DN444_c0_g1_i1.p1  ORF type:complete len:484 (-),score=123.89 TRINITY_DN444_c0_g1_i1:37-1488(-)